MSNELIMQNRLYRGDCLEVMRRLHSEDIAPDLIYLDPPFNSSRNYNIIFHGGGKGAQQVAFSDMWEKAYREETERDIAAVAADLGTDDRLVKLLRSWTEILGAGRADEKGLLNYLLYMAHRLLWCHKVLSAKGSIYLHCDPTASHYLKAMMDLIFGRRNFRNEIVWCYTGPSAAKRDFPRKHDTILRYAKSGEFVFNHDAVRISYSESSVSRAKYGLGEGSWGDKESDWLQSGGKIPESYWTDIPIERKQSERMGFNTQKPRPLLDRIIKASSNEGDWVFDPFCGCGTTIHAAHNLKRKWIGVDISMDALLHIQTRVKQRLSLGADGYDMVECGAQSPEDYERLSVFEKQEWLVRKVGGICGPKGGDGGADGVIRYHLGGDNWEFGEFVISVKTGKQANPAMMDQLKGVMEKRGAQMGGLILDRQPTRGMLDIALKSKRVSYKMKIMGVSQAIGEFPSVQILTSAQIFAGEKFVMPPTLMEKKLQTGG